VRFIPRGGVYGFIMPKRHRFRLQPERFFFDRSR